MQTSQMLIQVLNGISYGLLLFLIASGLSLIFGLMGVINLAHGSFYMMGTYVGIEIFRLTGSFTLSLIVAALAVAVIGGLVERIFLSKLYKQELDQVLLTFGFAYIFTDLCKWFWGGTPKSLPKPSLLDRSITIFGNDFPVYRLALIAVGVIIAIVLQLFLEKTRTGMIIRAGVDDKEMVGGMGINIKLYFTGIFILGALLAAIGGVVGGPVIGAYVGMDTDILVLALAVVVVGGLGTLKGAFWGSLLIGLIETFGKVFLPNYSIVTVYAAMVLILIFKPQGLFGKEEET